ncbi:MAG TPA: FAD-binding oxidoreductase [Acidimicrobiales bacterium]|nr:FAD-binding oxidoreductase [Acidimicrobiales bacterium]
MTDPPTGTTTAPTALTGWGGTGATVAQVASPRGPDDVARLLARASDRGVIARGLGRSYGDSATNAGGTVVDCTSLSGVRSLDPRTGVAVVDAGSSLDQLMRDLVPQGWFVPVTPGTRQVTVGGAIASDIHGKDHHVRGSFCQWVDAVTLLLPSGERRVVGPEREPALFWATAGGMGLTGMVLDATLRLQPITTSRLVVDTERAPDLESCMARMVEGDALHRYSVAWIDCLAQGASLGRSVLTRGDHATVDQLPRRQRAEPLRYEVGPRLTIPVDVPSGLLNRFSVGAFNELWYRKPSSDRLGEVQGITRFFHPLDTVVGWNRLYGRRGFLQHQFVVPLGAEATLRAIVERLAAARCASFLGVLKRFGPGNPGPLSFPIPGWTLALDIPVGDPDLSGLLDGIDDLVAEAGGRLYLAKDSRMRAELLPTMYPRLEEWRAVRRSVDPDGVLQSDQSRRLGLS